MHVLREPAMKDFAVTVTDHDDAEYEPQRQKR
jgi:hypothetical protein